MVELETVSVRYSLEKDSTGYRTTGCCDTGWVEKLAVQVRKSRGNERKVEETLTESQGEFLGPTFLVHLRAKVFGRGALRVAIRRSLLVKHFIPTFIPPRVIVPRGPHRPGPERGSFDTMEERILPEVRKRW